MVTVYGIVKKTRLMDVILNSSTGLFPLLIGAYQLIDFGFLVLLIFFCCINAFTFLLNDYYDRVADARDEKKRNFNYFSSTNPQDRFLGRLLLVVFLSLTVLLPVLFFQHLLPLTAIGLTLSYSYSNPRINLKNRPVFDWLIHSFWPILLISVSYLYFYDDLNSTYWFLIAIGALIGFYAQINNQVRDFYIDKENNQINTSIWLGYEKAVTAKKINAFLIFLMAYIAVLFTSAFLTLLTISLSLAFFIKKGNIDRFNYHNIIWAGVFIIEKFILSAL